MALMIIVGGRRSFVVHNNDHNDATTVADYANDVTADYNKDVDMLILPRRRCYSMYMSKNLTFAIDTFVSLPLLSIVCKYVLHFYTRIKCNFALDDGDGSTTYTRWLLFQSLLCIVVLRFTCCSRLCPPISFLLGVFENLCHLGEWQYNSSFL